MQVKPGMVGPCLVPHPFPWDLIGLIDVLYMVDLSFEGRSNRDALKYEILIINSRLTHPVLCYPE